MPVLKFIQFVGFASRYFFNILFKLTALCVIGWTFEYKNLRHIYTYICSMGRGFYHHSVGTTRALQIAVWVCLHSFISMGHSLELIYLNVVFASA